MLFRCSSVLEVRWKSPGKSIWRRVCCVPFGKVTFVDTHTLSLPPRLTLPASHAYPSLTRSRAIESSLRNMTRLGAAMPAGVQPMTRQNIVVRSKLFTYLYATSIRFPRFPCEGVDAFRDVPIPRSRNCWDDF